MVKEPGKKAGGNSVPVEEGLFTLPKSAAEKPSLIGSRCRQCGEVFFPKRMVCLKCSAIDMEEIPLSTKGKLYSFTITRQAPPGSVINVPYVLASVELPEGVNVHTVLTDCDLEKVRIGMDVEMVLETITQDKDGRDVVGFKFKPCWYPVPEIR